MLELNERILRGWADEIKIDDLVLAEQDFRLTHILRDISSDDFLSERLYLKGGTAINKLYLKETPRLSIDLDFNAVGEKQKVMAERDAIRDRLIGLLEEQDPDYRVRHDHRYEQTAIRAKYTPIFGAEQTLKLEISYVERFPILRERRIELVLPFIDESFEITTYQLEELASTKVRALYDRLTGRDIYDIYQVSSFDLDLRALRKMVLYYFYRSKKIFNPKLFFRNLETKFNSGRLIDDISSFIRSDIRFSLERAVEDVTSFCSFLWELDERDEIFLALAGDLLGKEVSKKKLAIASAIEHPLSYLFDDIAVTDHARKATVDDIRVFLRRK